MWPVIILTLTVITNGVCRYEEAAVGILPNGKYVVITQKVDLMLTLKQKEGDFKIAVDEQDKHYTILIIDHTANKSQKDGFIVFLTEVTEPNKQLKRRAVPGGLVLIISSDNLCAQESRLFDWRTIHFE
jgi:hypothetical protein